MMKSIRDDIQAEAETLGFSLAGIVAPQPPVHLSVFERWLDQGKHGAMAYLATPHSLRRRADPGSILPEARSVLSLAALYSSPLNFPEEPRTGAIHGRVAAYAWGEDYHAVLPPRLDQLAGRIAKILDRPVKQKRYTDTGPILERDLAQQAGLGWIGKNTCLISPQIGSFFFLAELFVDAELEPDPSFPYDRCGSCQRCIQACPTACIAPDRTIDAAHCISYQTIENKAEIPLDLRPQMGDWVFGCDVCQEVCPWNIRFAPASGDPTFSPRPTIPRPDLVAELKLTPQEFNRKFKNSPVLRARRRGYLRNVAVALGNQPDPDSVPALAEALLSEPEPLVRAHAAWALGRITHPSAPRALAKAATSETDPDVLIEIRRSIDSSN